MSIRYKLAFLMFVFAAIPLLFAGFLSEKESLQILREEHGEHGLESARIYAQTLQEHLYSIYQNAKTISSFTFFCEGPNENEKAILSYLLQWEKNFPEIAYVMCAEMDGSVCFSTLPRITGTNVSKNPPFAKALKKQESWEEIFYDESLKTYLLRLWIPRFKKDSPTTLGGIFCVALDWKKIQNHIATIEILNQPQDIANHIMVADEKGRILYCYDFENNFHLNLIKIGITSALLASAESEGYLFEKTEHGLLSFTSYTYFKKTREMPRLPWILLLYQDAEKITSDINLLSKPVVWTVVILILLTIPFALVISRWISYPLEKISHAAREFGKGNPIQKEILYHGEDEVGELSRSFEQMMENLSKSQTELKIEKDFTDGIIQSLMDPLVIVSMDGTMEVMNRPTLELLGYEKEEMRGKKIDLIFFTQEESYFYTQCSNEDIRIHNFEISLRHKNGSSIPVLLNISRMLHRDTQKYVYAIRDITRRREMEDSLRESKKDLQRSEEQYRNLVEVSPDAILVVQKDQLIYINPAGIQLLGYDSSKDVLPMDLEKIWENHKVYFQEKYTWVKVSQEKFIKKDGSLLEVEVSAIQTSIDGMESFQIMARDITELKNLREKNLRMEHLASLGELSATLAHEIRNPLSAVGLSFKNLMDSKIEWGDSLRTVQNIEKGIGKIENILNGILDFARPPQPQFHKKNIAKILKNTLKFLQEEFTKKGIQVESQMDENIPDVIIDSSQVFQVFTNLLVNAMQAMPEGGKIKVSAEKKDSWIEIQIQDSGIGICPQIQKKIFQPFFTTKTEGTGLGLAVVARILEQHNAKIDLQSQMGQGTTFILKFPIPLN